MFYFNQTGGADFGKGRFACVQTTLRGVIEMGIGRFVSTGNEDMNARKRHANKESLNYNRDVRKGSSIVVGLFGRISDFRIS